MPRPHSPFLGGLAGLLAAAVVPAPAADWPTWCRDSTRNAVSPEKGAPVAFQLPITEDGKVVKPAKGVAWQAELGSFNVGTPVVADGLVWVGTNNDRPRDPRLTGDAAVLMCFRESDGKFLWQYVSPRLPQGMILDWPMGGMGSTPLVEGDRLWLATNRGEVLCLDIGPLRRGTGTPTVAWKLDMIKDLGVFSRQGSMHLGFAASVAGYKGWLYAVTHNGVDETHVNLPTPDAPSLVCVEKATGRVVWKDNSPGKGILHLQFSSPMVAEVNGRAQVIVGQGDGWLRSFDAGTGKLIWKCDLNPKDAVYDLGGTGTRNYVVATPIFYNGRVYVATGQEAEHSTGVGAMYCIDPTREGDVSPELPDGPRKGKPNPNSAAVWHTRGPVPADVPSPTAGAKRKRDPLRDRGYLFGRTVSTPVAHDGLLYAAELRDFVFCFDARTGKVHWVDDTKSGIQASLLWADGKVYVGTDGGDLFVYAHGREKERLAHVETDGYMHGSPIFANGSLYLTTSRGLSAVRGPKGDRP
jgi:outer membrane protein assembly factor BamB